MRLIFKRIMNIRIISEQKPNALQKASSNSFESEISYTAIQTNLIQCIKNQTKPFSFFNPIDKKINNASQKKIHSKKQSTKT